MLTWARNHAGKHYELATDTGLEPLKRDLVLLQEARRVAISILHDFVGSGLENVISFRGDLT